MKIRTSLLAFALLFSSYSVASNGYLPIGIGAKSKGMAGVGIALPQDAFTVATNPAGAAHLCSRIDIAGMWLNHDATFSLYEHERRQDQLVQCGRTTENIWWPEGAALWRFCGNHTLGFAAYYNGGWDVQYDEPVIFFGDTPLRSRFRQYNFSPSWTWKVNCMHSLGMTLNAVVGAMKFDGLQDFASQSIDPERVSNRGFDHQWGVSARFGWLAQLTQDVAIGLVYQTPTWFGDFSDYRGFVADEGDFLGPTQFGGGITWRFHQLMILSVDALKIFFRDAALLDNGTVDRGPYGRVDGPGFGWNDMTVLKFGVLWEMRSNLTFRVGLNHAMAAIPTCETLINFMTQQTVKDTLTLGLTFYCKCHEVSVAYNRGFCHNIGGKNVIFGTEALTFASIRSKETGVTAQWGYRF